MISIIVPTYNEEQNLVELHERLAATARNLPSYNFEFLFVDDCSEDETPRLLENLSLADDRVKTIRFARNCGSHPGVAAGLHFCRGDAGIVIAADLQDPPEIIPELLLQWKKGFKVVWGVRDKREGENCFTLLCSRVFYFLMNRLTNVEQASTGADVFLIDRMVIEAFRAAPEKNPSVYMLIAWLGYPQTTITYVKEARHAGASKWTKWKKVKLFFDSLISFSYIPLRFMSIVGTLAACLGLLYGVIVFLNGLRGHPVHGWSSLMVVVLLLGGVQMIMLGMLGEYVWRTYDETRGRPMYVIEKNTLLEGGGQCDQKEKEPIDE